MLPQKSVEDIESTKDVMFFLIGLVRRGRRPLLLDAAVLLSYTIIEY